MKRAEVYIRRGVLIVYASSRTTDGVWLGEPPFVTLKADASADEKGAHILDALRRSKNDIPHPQRWDGADQGLMAAAGVKNWSTFVKLARAVSVEENGGKIALIPMKNLGERDGFVEVGEHTIHVEAVASSGTIGSALDRAIERTE